MSQSHSKVKHPSFFLKEKKGVELFNQRVALLVASVLSSMYFFYFCVVLDFVELPSVVHAHSAIAWVSYISSVVIQLLALPVLSAQSNIQQMNKDASDQAMHMALTHVAKTVDDINNKMSPREISEANEWE